MTSAGALKATTLGPLPSDWRVVTLAEIGQPRIGLTYKPSDVRDHGTLVLRSSNVQDGRLSFEDNVFVDPAIASKASVESGDILICVRNGSRALIGKCARIDDRADGMAFGAFMSVFRTPYSRFVFRQFQSDGMKRQIEQHLGATINQITNKSLRSFIIPFVDDKNERDAIVGIIDETDQLISSIDELITKKCNLRSAVSRQLLSGEVRLPGFDQKWIIKNLGDLGTFLKGSGVRRDQAMSGELPCVRYGEIYTNHDNLIRNFSSFISAEVAKTATPIERGDLLFAGSGETKEEIGKCVAFVSNELAYAGGDIVILRPHWGDPVFLGYRMNAPDVARQKASLGQGDAVVHISAGALAAVSVKMPEPNEQAAIGTVLASIDEEIAELRIKRTKIAQVLEGMMQQLLTGRIRVV